MSITSRHPGTLVAVFPWAIITGLVALLSAPCFADIAPESGLFAHVQGVSQEACETSITHCEQIIRSTSADGPLEFLLFFMRGAYSWPGETVCIRSLQTMLSWPETWQLVEFEPCGWPYDASLDPDGPSHALWIDWYEPYVGTYYEISASPEGVIPVARLVMNVAGSGQLDFTAPYAEVRLRHYCTGSTFVTHPVQVGAEAGMQCGYASTHCGYGAERCLASFEVPDLRLHAVSGAAADSTIDFWAEHMYLGGTLCPLTVDTHAPWCTAWIEVEYDEHGNELPHLHVTADAAGLSWGTYETQVELYHAGYEASRCLPVEFTVEEAPTAALIMSWGRIKGLFR